MPEDYSFESLFRFGVDKEKSGFDQCRNRLIGYLDHRIEELGDVPRYMEEELGKLQAYKDVLAYLKGADRGETAGPEQHDTGATG